MLHEYALDPSLLCNWSDFRFFLSQFGFDTGRLIARFPTKWKRMVHEKLAGCKPIERAKIVEALTRIDARMIKRHEPQYDPNYDWLTNAVSEHDRLPFRAIISDSNPRTHPAVIVGADLDVTLDYNALPENDSRRLWNVSRSKVINRNAVDMADAIEKLIQQADRLVFVDPHFGPENPRYRIPFEEFMSRLHLRRGGKLPSTAEFHCAVKSEVSFFREQCESKLAGMIPIGLRLMFRRWSKDDMHNRFVLTDCGGIAFLQGLDHFDGKGPDTDVVVLLDRETSQQLMNQYTVGETPFKLSDEGEFEVIGTCPPCPLDS